MGDERERADVAGRDLGLGPLGGGRPEGTSRPAIEGVSRTDRIGDHELAGLHREYPDDPILRDILRAPEVLFLVSWFSGHVVGDGVILLLPVGLIGPIPEGALRKRVCGLGGGGLDAAHARPAEEPIPRAREGRDLDRSARLVARGPSASPCPGVVLASEHVRDGVGVGLPDRIKRHIADGAGREAPASILCELHRTRPAREGVSIPGHIREEGLAGHIIGGGVHRSVHPRRASAVQVERGGVGDHIPARRDGVRGLLLIPFGRSREEGLDGGLVQVRHVVELEARPRPDISFEGMLFVHLSIRIGDLHACRAPCPGARPGAEGVSAVGEDARGRGEGVSGLCVIHLRGRCVLIPCEPRCVVQDVAGRADHPVEGHRLPHIPGAVLGQEPLRGDGCRHIGRPAAV